MKTASEAEGGFRLCGRLGDETVLHVRLLPAEPAFRLAAASLLMRPEADWSGWELV